MRSDAERGERDKQGEQEVSPRGDLLRGHQQSQGDGGERERQQRCGDTVSHSVARHGVQCDARLGAFPTRVAMASRAAGRRAVR